MKGRGRAKVAQVAVAEVDEPFLARLLHDLRNPLGVIAFFAESIPEAAEHERAEFCERLRINAQRALHILEEFALLADLRCGRAQVAEDPVDLAALVSELAAGLAAERGGAHIDGAGVAGLVLAGDAQQWQRALRALLRDTSRGASGDVVIDGEGEKGRLTLRVGVPLSVDRELGISARLDPAGVGIEIVKRLAHLHRGDLTIAQRSGRAVLTLVVPG